MRSPEGQALLDWICWQHLLLLRARLDSNRFDGWL